MHAVLLIRGMRAPNCQNASSCQSVEIKSLTHEQTLTESERQEFHSVSAASSLGVGYNSLMQYCACYR